MEKEKLLEIARQVSLMLQEEFGKLPYSANAIDELHANENAHSRLLRMFLQYSGGRTWPIYRSFLKLIKDHCSLFPFDCNGPDFVNEEGRIDLLITDSNNNQKWAIIVENKVCEAGDQDEQIARYISKTETMGVTSHNIFVVYLTSDGTKKASSYSLTDEAKRKLCFNDEFDKGRYIELNYRYDILPWIEHYVLPNVPLKEDLLISSLKLYIDYLKGMFDLRNDGEIIHEKTQQTIMNKYLTINTIQDGFSVMEDLNNLQFEINAIIRSKASSILDEHLQKPLSNFLSKVNGSISDLEYYSDNRFCCGIDFLKWKKIQIRITQEEQIGIYGICHKDANNNPLDENTIYKLRNLFPKTKKSYWWPVYNRLDVLDDTAGTNKLWNSIENECFCRKFVEWINTILTETNGLEL